MEGQGQGQGQVPPNKVKICQTCGDKGVSNALIYCTECWNTVEHIYCQGLSLSDIHDNFNWICHSCVPIKGRLAKRVVYGENPDQNSRSTGDGALKSDLSMHARATPVIGPIWRGTFDVCGSLYGTFDGLEAFLPNTSYLKAVRIAQIMRPSIFGNMKKRGDVWPKYFSELGATDYNVDFYIFPEFSRSEREYDYLVEYMISKDLALRCLLGDLVLTVFTSLELQNSQQQRVQGKYYLWGIFNWQKKIQKHVPELKAQSLAKHRIRKGWVNGRFNKIPRIKHPTAYIRQFGFGSKKVIKHKDTRTTSRLCDHTPSLGTECKRARSTRRKGLIVLNRKAHTGQDDTPGKDGKAGMFQEVVRSQPRPDNGKEHVVTEQNCLPVVAEETDGTNDMHVLNELAIVVSDENRCKVQPDDVAGFNCSREGSLKVDDILSSQGNTDEQMVEAEKPDRQTDMDLDESSTRKSPCRISQEEEDNQISVCNVVDACETHVDACQVSEAEEASIDMEPSTLKIRQHDPLNPLVHIQMLEWRDQQTFNATQAIIAEDNSCSTPVINYLEASEPDAPSESLPIKTSVWPNTEDDTCSTPVLDVQDDLGEEASVEMILAVIGISIDNDTLHDGDIYSTLEPISTLLPDQIPEIQTQQAQLKNESVATYADNIRCSIPLHVYGGQSEMTGLNIQTTSETKTDVTLPDSIVKMGDEYQETPSDWVTTKVGRYTIKADLAPILSNILGKYGDIAQDCTVPELVLENICKVIQELASIPLKALSRHHVDRLKKELEIPEALGVNMTWLSKRCQDLEQLVHKIRRYPSLKTEMEHHKKEVQHAEDILRLKRTELAKLQDEIKSLEGKCNLGKEKIEQLNDQLEDIGQVSKRCRRSVMEYLF